MNEEVQTDEEIKEEASEINTEIGTKETASLMAATVVIDSVAVETVEKGGKEIGKKVVCLCKHPDREELIGISSVEYKKGKNLKTSGLWFKRDEDGLIPKQSALAQFLNYTKVTTIKELNTKQLETTLDENNYLAFKAY